MVSVECRPEGGSWACRVDIEHGGERTQHAVTVTAADLRRWARGATREDAENLVSRSFDFLLRREPAGSILRRFDLSVIQRYFPEYDREIRRG